MNLNAVISIIVYTKKEKLIVDNVINKYSASANYEDLTVGDREHYAYEIKLAYDPKKIECILNDLHKAEKRFRDSPDFFGFSFDYEANDFSDSPLFYVQSIGNKSGLYINSFLHKFEIYCKHCNRKKLIEDQKLVIDINKLERNPVLLVDHYFVVSEELAEQLKQSDLKGYTLIEVEHRGKKEARVKGYQIMPTNILPPQCVPLEYQKDPYILSQDNRCSVCNLGGHLFAPTYYNPKDLEEIKDFNFTYEYKEIEFVHRKTLISRKAIEFFKENTNFNNIILSGNARHEIKDWEVEPILFNSNC